jgi:hypothetical protein
VHFVLTPRIPILCSWDPAKGFLIFNKGWCIAFSNYLNYNEKMIFHLSSRLEKKDLQKDNAIRFSKFWRKQKCKKADKI